MKIIARLSLLVLVPIIVGLALTLSGNNAGVWVLSFGTPGVMIVLVIAGLIMMLMGKLFPKTPTNNESGPEEHIENDQARPDVNEDNGSAAGSGSVERPQKEQEKTALHDFSSTPTYTNRFDLAEHEAEHVVEGTKNASKKGCALVIIMVLLVVVDVILATVFTIKQIWVGAIVCAALFGVTIITGLITAVVRQKIAMNGDISKAKKIVDGKVKLCVLSSVVQHQRLRDPSVRLSNVVYRVVVGTDEGDFEAFSNQFYKPDDAITVAVMGKKRAKIVDKTEQDSQDGEIDKSEIESQSDSREN